MSNYSATYRKKTESSFDNLYLETDSTLVENSDTTKLDSSIDYMYEALDDFKNTKTTSEYATEEYDNIYDIGTNVSTNVTTFYNNWTNANVGTYGNLRYVKDTRGYIYMYGNISTSSTVIDGMDICAIPCTVENTEHLFSCSLNTKTTQLATTADGKLKIKKSNNENSIFINMYFYAGV